MTNAEKIQAVINTLATVTIPATYDNVNRMTGVFQTLAEVRDAMSGPEGPEEPEVTENV